jgi:hypothetical protein
MLGRWQRSIPAEIVGAAIRLFGLHPDGAKGVRETTVYRCTDGAGAIEVFGQSPTPHAFPAMIWIDDPLRLFPPEERTASRATLTDKLGKSEIALPNTSMKTSGVH